MKISYKPIILFIVFFGCWFKLNTNQTIAGFNKTDLEQLLSITHLTYDGTVDDLVKVTQKSWRRPNDKERWEIQEIFENKRQELLPIFTRMGLVNALTVARSSYDHILFIGAIIPNMQKRIVMFKNMFEGILYKDIVVLSGARDLTLSEQEQVERLGWKPTPVTEAQVIPFLFAQEGFKMEKVMLIDVPKIEKSPGVWARPTSEDTLEKWLMTKPTVGSILIISSQPFCCSQKIVVESLVSKDFSVDIVGTKAPESTKIAVYLDTIARSLYQWHNTQIKNKK